MSSITILGLGPGDPNHLTLEAHAALASSPALFVRTMIHPTIQTLPPTCTLTSFDHLYEQADSFEAIYATIASTLIAQAQTGTPVTFAVPGHPLIAEATTRTLLAEARAAGVEVNIIAGLSFLEPAFSALGIDPFAHGAQLLDALDLIPTAAPPAQGPDRAWSELQGVGPYPPVTPMPLRPTQPALLCQLYSAAVAAEVKLSLLERYPAEHPVTVVRHAGLPSLALSTLPLAELDRARDLDHLTCLYVPPLAPAEDLRSFETVQWVMQRLAGPFGCPWDRKQTHATLRRYLLEETHEALEALDQEDWAAFADELGDVLLQIVFHAELGRQAGTFDFGDVAAALNAKMIRRHPHIFADAVVSDADEVLSNWEAIKATERAEAGSQKPASLLDGLPKSLPALAFAQQLGTKATKVGFDWPAIEGVWAKIVEELDELKAADPADQEAELGDVLFAITNLARWLKVDAEAALRGTSAKFRRRFMAMEAAAAAQGRTLDQLSLAESDALWEAAKAAERTQNS